MSHSQATPKSEPIDRMSVIRQLRASGWRHTDLCAQIQICDQQIGGPTYLTDPEGVIRALDETSCNPINGRFTRIVRGTREVAIFENGRLKQA